MISFDKSKKSALKLVYSKILMLKNQKIGSFLKKWRTMKTIKNRSGKNGSSNIWSMTFVVAEKNPLNVTLF